MNKRIRQLRKSLGLSQKEFGEGIGVKQNAVSNMEKDGQAITEQTIKIICANFNVNEIWLRTGSGKIFLENEIRRKELSKLLDELSPVFQECLLEAAKVLLKTQNRIQASEDEPAVKQGVDDRFL